MLVTIEDSRITTIIDSTDARLISLRDVSGHEYIQQRGPKYWKRCSPPLFPVVSNCWNNRTILKDHIYVIEKCDFCRERNFDVPQEASSKTVFPMGGTPDAHKVYPYAFRLSLACELKGGVLFMKYQVESRDQCDMRYAIGVHPGSNCPMEEGYALGDYQLVFGKKKSTISISYDLDQLYFTPYKTGTTLKGSILPLSREMFKYDAVFFDRLNSRIVLILNPTAGCGVEVGFPDFETVALQTLCPEPTPYLCVEPWNGSGIYENKDDQLSHRYHIQHLCPGDSRSYVMTIRILERFPKQ